ncbi:MAG TPA: hypothetical protein VI322_02815 [Candidatus Saccharimonadia bacterium]
MTVGIGSLDEETWRTRVDAEVVPAEAFARRAQSITEFIDEHRDELGLNGALTAASERFVEHEANVELKHFAEVVVGARRQARLQDWLDDDRERLHHGRLGHDELTSVGHHYETLRHEACVYNHKLRSVIELSGHNFTRDDLTNWLVSVSQGRHEWARAEVTGAVSEVALHAALQGLPELVGLRYATVEEDLAGYDFLAEYQGKLLTIDAKTGRYWPLAERKHGHRHMEVSVPREAVDGFTVTRPGLNRLRQEVRQSLGVQRREGEHGWHETAPPKHYHHVQHPWRTTYENAN